MPGAEDFTFTAQKKLITFWGKKYYVKIKKTSRNDSGAVMHYRAVPSPPEEARGQQNKTTKQGENTMTIKKKELAKQIRKEYKEARAWLRLDCRHTYQMMKNAEKGRARD